MKGADINRKLVGIRTDVGWHQHTPAVECYRIEALVAQRRFKTGRCRHLPTSCRAVISHRHFTQSFHVVISINKVRHVRVSKGTSRHPLRCRLFDHFRCRLSRLWSYGQRSRALGFYDRRRENGSVGAYQRGRLPQAQGLSRTALFQY